MISEPEPFLAVTYTQDVTLPIRHYEEVKGWILSDKKLDFIQKLCDKKRAIEMEYKQMKRTCKSDFFSILRTWPC